MGTRSNFEEAPTIPGTRSLHRALIILQAFTDERPRWSVSALAAELGLSKSTTHRILAALEEEAFLTRTPGSTDFQLGPELIVLGTRALNTIKVRDQARAELEALARTTGEDATLECLLNHHILILDEEKGQSLLGLESSVGTLWPVHATSTGKVLMAEAENPMTEPEGGLAAFTSNTIVSWEEWEEALEEARANGYAVTYEELEYGWVAVAAPVRDRTGRTMTAISVGGSVHRIGKERIPKLVHVVRDAASRVSRRLGYRGSEETLQRRSGRSPLATASRGGLSGRSRASI